MSIRPSPTTAVLLLSIRTRMYLFAGYFVRMVYYTCSPLRQANAPRIILLSLSYHTKARRTADNMSARTYTYRTSLLAGQHTEWPTADVVTLSSLILPKRKGENKLCGEGTAHTR